MNSNDFDEIFSQAGNLLKLLNKVFEGVTGEPLDLESAVRHYPLLAVGLAAGTGAIGGWLLARRSSPQLPPPAPSRPLDSLPDIRSKLRPAEETGPAQQPVHPLEYLEQLVPEGLDRLRNVLPDVTSEEASALAREWADVLEPKVKQGLDTVVANLSESRFGIYFRRRAQRTDDEEGSDESPKGDA